MPAFAWFTAAMTVLLLFAGAMVTSTGSGLSVPDWPLSFGQVMPPMQGGVFYEHGHRLIASGVGLLTFILALGLARRERRRWLRRLGLLALAAVVLQGLLGGLTVLYRLPLAVSVGHAVLAQLFLCLLVGMAVALSDTWKTAPPPKAGERRGGWVPLRTQREAAWSMGLWGLIVLQLIVAAIMRHRGAGLAIPDFPLAHGRLVPDLGHPLVAIHYAHRVLALLIALYAAALSASVLRRYRGLAAITGTTWGLLSLLAAQIALGAWTVLSFKHHLVASLHLATGALVLAMATALTLLLWRLGHRPASTGPAPHWRSGDILAFTRLRLNLLVLAATALGFFLGAPPGGGAFFWTLLGVGLAATASAILNQAQEAERDAAMARTRLRPIPAGLIGRGGAAALGLGLAVLGLAILAWQVNALTAGLTLATLAIYHLVYTPLKTRTTLNTIIGAVPGALPPVLGYTAARGALEAPALALFAIVFLWQIPHFLSIALRYQAEYAAAGFRMLPQAAESFARRQILVWGLALLPASLLPCMLGLAGRAYGVLALALGLGFLAVMWPVSRGLTAARVRALFVGSLVYLPALFLFLVLDRLGPW